MTRRHRAGAIALVVALAPACSGGGGDGDRFSLELDGRARVVTSDGSRVLEDGRHDLERGDEVRVVSGSAVLELPGEREVRLRGESAVKVDDQPDLIDGDAVVVSDAADTEFTVGNVEVSVNEGAARVQRGLGVTIAMYRGDAEVRSAGRAFPGGLAAYRQVTVPATGLLPREPVPLVYDPARPDPWDREFLGGALELGLDLDRMSRGFTNQLGLRPRFDGAVLRRVLPALEDRDDFSESLVEAGRSPGESLVGAAIVVESDPDAGQFAQRWSDVFEFRRDGAQWGLVALDQSVERDTLRGQLASAINASPLLFAVGPASAGGPAVAPTTTVPPGDNGSGSEPPPDDDPEPPDDPIPPVPLPTIPPIPGEPAPEEPADPDGSDPEPPDDADDLVGDIIESLLP